MSNRDNTQSIPAQARQVFRFMGGEEAQRLCGMRKVVSGRRHTDMRMPGDWVEGITFFPGGREQAEWLMDFAASIGCSMEYLLVGTPAPGGRLDRMERRCSLFRDGTGWRPLDEFSTLGYRLEDFGEYAFYRLDGGKPMHSPIVSRLAGWAERDDNQH